jgi:hypothetical protein
VTEDRRRGDIDVLIDAGLTVHEAIDAVGFEIVDRTEEGEIVHCCGQPVTSGSGIFGTDILRCEQCGASIRMFTSPHINGGVVLSEELTARIGDREWHVQPSPGRAAE